MPAALTETLALLADATRLRVLLLLQEQELSVVELQEILGMGQSRISNHLAQLRQAGLVRDRRAGKNSYYALGDAPALRDLASVLAAAGREIPEVSRDATALKVAMKKRADTSREYFNKLAGRFGRTYCPGRAWEAVANFLFLLVPKSLVVADLGAGEGTLAQMLAKRAKRVIAVDNSDKMVEFGSNLAREHGFTNLEYRLGDLEAPPISAGTVDLALLSQALHHAEHPAQAVAAAQRILKRGGRLVILDLLQHQFEDARELYADRWLGFSEADLHSWLEESGFQDIEVTIVAREAQPPHLQTVLATGVKT
jgi:ubiquinone/menaquinone biosynthesis C-methylase UbiE/DNA-binding transcriptional ArsR family regulator